MTWHRFFKQNTVQEKQSDAYKIRNYRKRSQDKSLDSAEQSESHKEIEKESASECS